MASHGQASRPNIYRLLCFVRCQMQFIEIGQPTAWQNPSFTECYLPIAKS